MKALPQLVPRHGRCRPMGYHFEAVPHDNLEWVVPSVTMTGCRFMEHRQQCGRVPVATLYRGATRRPYNYCERHLYGRWIEDGQIMHWRLVPDAD